MTDYHLVSSPLSFFRALRCPAPHSDNSLLLPVCLLYLKSHNKHYSSTVVYEYADGSGHQMANFIRDVRS